jgi:hypothetical protein
MLDTMTDWIMLQLGGTSFQLKTGVRNPKPIPNGVSLDLPPHRAYMKADQAQIVLVSDGTISIEITKRNGRAFRWIDIADGVPVEEMKSRFSEMTGLEI